MRGLSFLVSREISRFSEFHLLSILGLNARTDCFLNSARSAVEIRIRVLPAHIEPEIPLSFSVIAIYDI